MSMKISFICHSSLSGIFLQKDCGQAAMTAFNTYFRVNDETAGFIMQYPINTNALKKRYLLCFVFRGEHRVVIVKTGGAVLLGILDDF